MIINISSWDFLFGMIAGAVVMFILWLIITLIVKGFEEDGGVK